MQKVIKSENAKTQKVTKIKMMKIDQKKCQKMTPPQKPQNVR